VKVGGIVGVEVDPGTALASKNLGVATLCTLAEEAPEMRKLEVLDAHQSCCVVSCGERSATHIEKLGKPDDESTDQRRFVGDFAAAFAAAGTPNPAGVD